MEIIKKIISLEDSISRQGCLIPYVGMEKDAKGDFILNPNGCWGRYPYDVNIELCEGFESLKEYFIHKLYKNNLELSMGFIDETNNILGLSDFSNTFLCYATINGVVVEGYKKIYELSNKKITLFCENAKKIDIIGENLEIKELSHKEICIKGEISSINFL